MLSKTNRMNKETFDEVFKKGRSLNSENFDIKVLKTNNPDKKFSFSAPKKTIKGSIKRHLLKRRVYSVIRKNLENIPAGTLAIFFLKKEGSEINFQEIEKEILHIIKKYF